MYESAAMSKDEILNVLRYFASGGKGYYFRLLQTIYDDPPRGEALLQSIAEKKPRDFVDVIYAVEGTAV